MRYRVTVRGLGVEIRGRFDELTDEDAPTLAEFAEAMKPFGLVIASPAKDDYDPFGITEPDNPPSREKSAELIEAWIDQFGDDRAGLLEHLADIHFNQALVIRGERWRAEQMEREMLSRELHHFETEEENASLKAALRRTEGLNRELVAEVEALKADHTDSEKNLIDVVNKQADLLERIRLARDNHPDFPLCEKHPDEEDYVKCGWRSAVEDIDKVLVEVPA